MIKIFTNEEAERRVLFCNNLRYIINNGTMLNKDIAKKAGISKSQLQQYKSGRQYPSEDKIQKLANALGVTVDELFDDTNAPWKFAENMKD